MRDIIMLFLLLCYFAASSQQQSHSLLSKIKTTPSDTGKTSIYLDLSLHYQYSKPDSAVYYAQQGITLAKKLNYRLGEAKLMGQLGAINEKHDNLLEAHQYALQSLAIYRRLNHSVGIASEYNALGIVAGKRGDYKTATSYFIQALRLFEKAKHKPGIVQAYIKLGVVNDLRGNLDKALEYYHRARKINGDDPAGLFTLLNNIGIVEAKKGDLKKALNYFEDGSRMSGSANYAAIHVNLLMNAAKALDQLGNKKEALKRLKMVLQRTRDFDLPETEARALINLSALEPARTLAHLQYAHSIASEIGNKQLLAETYKAKAEYYKKDQNYEASIVALEEHHSIMDSLFNTTKEKEIAGMQASYELEKSKEKIKTLELINQKRTAERNAVVIVIGCILFACGGLWLYLNKVRKLNRQLEESNKVKDKLFSVIGHDLRSPVGGIVQMMEVIEDGLLNESELKKLMSDLKKHSVASLEMLDSLLVWGNAQLQGVKVRRASFESKQVIQKNLTIFQRIAQEKMVVINDSTPAQLRLYGDRDHFDFVIRNLLSNAVKFCYPSGTIKITVSTTKKAGFAVFAVEDNGKGIGEQMLSKLFQPDMLSEDGTAGEKGTGLGLVLCKEFLTASGGNIWAESAAGKGAVFYFSLPCIRHVKKNRFKEIAETPEATEL